MAVAQVQKAVLVIADIGGYTRFMKLTRFNLAHAQQIVAELLEAVIDAAGPLRLSKLEGDAALFWLPADTKEAAEETSRRLVLIRQAFMKARDRLAMDSMCTCESCQQITNLKIKFVAHEGEVALQKVKRHTELAGVDVILVHRMLKNDVPVPEYVLVTDELKARLPADIDEHALTLQHDFEGIGEVRTHYVDLEKVPAQHEPVKPSFVRRWWGKLLLELRSVPVLLGLSKPRPREALPPSS